MIDDMGIFRTTLGITAFGTGSHRREVADVMVDTGSEYNWIPEDLLAEIGVAPVRIDRFETADGHVIERPIGFAILDAAGVSAATIVVFARAGDMALLGAHGIEGMNLRIDLVKKELVSAGPVPAAVAA
jgi:predicted aspartyl protease